MSRKVFLLPGLLLVLTVAACQTTSFTRPADPAHAWVDGKWSTTSGWSQSLALKAGDGNKVKGTFTLTSPNSGRTFSGDVSGEVNGTNLKLTAPMYQLSDTHKFDLERNGDALFGTRTSSRGEYSLQFVKQP